MQDRLTHDQGRDTWKRRSSAFSPQKPLKAGASALSAAGPRSSMRYPSPGTAYTHTPCFEIAYLTRVPGYGAQCTGQHAEANGHWLLRSHSASLHRCASDMGSRVRHVSSSIRIHAEMHVRPTRLTWAASRKAWLFEALAAEGKALTSVTRVPRACAASFSSCSWRRLHRNRRHMSTAESMKLQLEAWRCHSAGACPGSSAWHTPRYTQMTALVRRLCQRCHKMSINYRHAADKQAGQHIQHLDVETLQMVETRLVCLTWRWTAQARCAPAAVKLLTAPRATTGPSRLQLAPAQVEQRPQRAQRAPRHPAAPHCA